MGALRPLSRTTRKKYDSILERIGDEDPVAWLHRNLTAGTPIGTVLCLRGAVSRLLREKHGWTELDVKEKLPPAVGAEGEEREGLSDRQLDLYLEVVAEHNDGPVKTILLLLPYTGLRISEITDLRRSNVKTLDGRLYLHFVGKGQRRRKVPLREEAQEILVNYVQLAQPTDWLFPNNLGTAPISPATVRKFTRKIAAEHKPLEDLSPHILRHTAATRWVRRGVDIDRVKRLLGHKKLATTERYLHANLGDLFDAVDR